MMHTKRLRQLAIIVVLAAVAVVAVIFLGRNSSQASDTHIQKSSRETTRLFEGIPQHGTILGNPDAPATLTEFADLQCYPCSAYTEEVLPGLIERYVRSGKLKLDLRVWVLPGHAVMSMYPTQIALATAQQEQLWQYVHLYFRTQTPQAPSEGHLTKLLDAIPGIDTDQALSDAHKSKVLEQIERTDRDAARYKLKQTPSLLVSKHNNYPKLLEIKDSWTAKDLLDAIGRQTS